MAEQQPEYRDPKEVEYLRYIHDLEMLASARKDRSKNLAEEYPGLIDKISRHEDLPDSEYHAVIPRMAFANLNDFQISFITGLDEPIMNDLLYAVKQNWLPVDVAKDYGARWTVTIEATRARNAGWSEFVFAEISKALFRKEEEGKKKGAFSSGGK